MAPSWPLYCSGCTSYPYSTVLLMEIETGSAESVMASTSSTFLDAMLQPQCTVTDLRINLQQLLQFAEQSESYPDIQFGQATGSTELSSCPHLEPCYNSRFLSSRRDRSHLRRASQQPLPTPTEPVPERQ
eukprot:scpid6094/ scgid22261/ 